MRIYYRQSISFINATNCNALGYINIFTMNSTVHLVDTRTGEKEAFTLVFPRDADIEQGRISVLAPVGTAILGYRAGDTFVWSVPGGERHLRIEAVTYQPEASGDYDL